MNEAKKKIVLKEDVTKFYHCTREKPVESDEIFTLLYYTTCRHENVKHSNQQRNAHKHIHEQHDAKIPAGTRLATLTLSAPSPSTAFLSQPSKPSSVHLSDITDRLFQPQHCIPNWAFKAQLCSAKSHTYPCTRLQSKKNESC